jgi:staphylococcal nuclease domain-containing protein 1
MSLWILFRAKKNMRGVHSKNKESAIHRVADISGDHSKAKQFLPFLQRAGRSVAIVEFVASGSRLRLYIPKETCLITFLLAGISCPRVSQAGRGGHQTEGEPFGQEALIFTKEFCLQRDVEVEVDNMDKAGNFIGWLFVDGQNLSVALVEAGLALVHFTADRSKYAKDLYSREDAAKAKKERIWANYEEPKAEDELVTEDSERQCEYQDVIVTEINGPISFWAQNGTTGPELETLMKQLRSEFAASPPPAGAYKPKKGDLCAAKFIDGQWYRARVEKIVSSSQIHILYIDFGNREETSTLSLASLPAAYSRLPSQATLYHLAFVNEPQDEEWIGESMIALKSDLLNHEMKLNVEYKSGSEVYVTVVDPENNADFGKSLVADGLLLVERRREKRLATLVEEYQIAQQEAKTARRNVWQYGDVTADTAIEFGYQKSS